MKSALARRRGNWRNLLMLWICLGRFMWRGISLVGRVEYVFWDHAGDGWLAGWLAGWLKVVAMFFFFPRVHTYVVYDPLISVHYYANAWSSSLFRPFPPVITLAFIFPKFNLDIPSRLHGP